MTIIRKECADLVSVNEQITSQIVKRAFENNNPVPAPLLEIYGLKSLKFKTRTEKNMHKEK